MSILIKKLHRAITDAEEANQAKSQFLANMSHELRTPLNGIIGASELLSMTQLSKQQQGYASLIQASGKTLLALIEDVLNISKIEAGKQTTEIEPFDLHVLISTTLQTFLPQAKKKGVMLTAHVHDDVPFRLKGDELHIRQILINFISNALKFTKVGGIKVLVELAEQTDDERCWLKFRVVDTGIGLSKEAQGKIFESFTQADISTTRQYGGTGLGTTISKELVALMGGEIGLESEEDKGSEFWFQLPLIRQEKQSKEKIASATSVSDTRVLILLPDDTSQQFLTPIQRWGQSVQTSTNVLDLFTSLSDAEHQEAPFHIAIVDQGLLGMPPEQLIESLRYKEGLAHTAFILTGEFFDETSVHSFIDEGYADVLTYPLNESLLFNAIHEICIGKSLHHDIPSIAQQHQKREQQVSLNILVAEDNEVNQVVIREFLELMGHEVIMVEDGEQALDALDIPVQAFDLALLDINMPHMSGLDVLKAYRFLEVDAYLPIIILSADAISSNIDECLEAGADAYLTKPIAYHKLAQAIDKIIPIEKKLPHKQVPTSLSSADVKWKYIDSDPLDGLSHISKKEHFVEGLIEKFIKRAKEDIGSLITAQEQVDAQTYIEIIHALKGASGMVGAVAIQHACEDIESLMKKASSPVKVSIVELQHIVQESIQELTRYVEKRSAQTQKNKE
ncbi:MAG: ATP-binding protein [Mariprofundaceae bacterium]|nr:ATP-binding protein [Mariprofundaceae bacterium]